MGRVGVPKRATKRAREAGKEFEEMRDKEVTKHVMAEKPDEQLFFLDRGQRKLTRSEMREIKRQKYIAGLPGGERSSEVEEKLIKKLAATVAKEGAKGEEKGEVKKPVYDMWGQEEKKNKKRKKKAAQKEEGEEEVTLPPPRVAKRKEILYKGREGVRLAPPVHPGQSYNPLEAHREDILKQAVAVEVAREAALSEARKPIPAMSHDTYALLLSSDDEDDDKEDEDGAGEEGEGSGAAGLKKRKGKLTKAQRNRLRRHKLTEQQARLQREHKALEKQANRARELAKALDRQEPSAAEEGGKKKRKRGGKKEAQASKTAPVFTARALDPLVLPREKNPIQRRSVDAPLSEELAGSLRLLHPVGSLAIDQLEALQKGGRYELTATHRKHRRAAKKVKYVDKRDLNDSD